MTFLLASSASKASVHLQTGGWLWNVNIEGIELIYNSRSLNHGWWGQGWCSDLDAEIIEGQDGIRHFRYCSQVIDDVSIHSSQNHFTVIYLGKFFLFNNRGRLISVRSPSIFIQVAYKGHLIEEITTNKTWRVKVSDKRKRITALYSDSSHIEFDYNSSLMIGIRRNDKVNKTFRYDALDNMISIEEQSDFSRRKLAQISYSTDDRVSEVLSANSCKTSYSFEQKRAGSEVLLRSNVQRSCAKFSNHIYTRTILSRFKLSGSDLKLVNVEEISL